MAAALSHPLNRLAAGLLALALAGACATTKPPPDAPKVVGLDIQGTDQVPRRQNQGPHRHLVNALVRAHQPVRQRARYFDPNAWQADLRRIERYYQSEGYYQARVVADAGGAARARTTVAVGPRVQEGEPTHLQRSRSRAGGAAARAARAGRSRTCR